MNYESFKYSSEEGIGHLVLNKGEDLNKMTMAEKLEEIKRLKKIQAEKIDMDDTKLISE